MYFLIDVSCRTFFSRFARNKHDCVKLRAYVVSYQIITNTRPQQV